MVRGIRGAESLRLLLTVSAPITVLIFTEPHAPEILRIETLFPICSQGESNCFEEGSHRWLGEKIPPLIITQCAPADKACWAPMERARKKLDATAIQQLAREEEEESKDSALSEFAKGFVHGIGIVAKVYLRNKPEIDRARARAKADAYTNAARIKADAAVAAGNNAVKTTNAAEMKRAQDLMESASKDTRRSYEVQNKADARYREAKDQQERDFYNNLAARDEKYGAKVTAQLEAAIASRVPGQAAPDARYCISQDNRNKTTMETINERGGYRNVCGIAVTAYYCRGNAEECSDSDMNSQVIPPGRSAIGEKGQPKIVCPRQALPKPDEFGNNRCQWF